MKIRLNEIPHEGRDYVFDRQSAELNSALNDLLAPEQPYKVEFHLKPIGSAFEVRGHLNAVTNEVCSKCGEDFQMKINRKINEILFEEQEDFRKSQSVRGNQSIDFESTSPTMTPYRGDVFEPGEFVHEMIALEEPFYPYCGPNETCLRANEIEEIQRRLEEESSVMDLEAKKEGNPAFASLKNLTLKN